MSLGRSMIVTRYTRGAVRSMRPSQYYMGFWPCRQSTGDDWTPSGVLTDVSGKGAHGTLGSLTDAEAGDNAGWLTTLDEALHCARIPAAYWTHRFATDSLIMHIRSIATKEASTECIAGNRGTGKGFSPWTVTTAGKLQWTVTNPTNTFFGTSTTSSPYSTAVAHNLFAAYDVTTGLQYIGVDGVLEVSASATITQANLIASDSDAHDGFAIGGRGGTSQNGSIAGQHAWFGAARLPGRALPTNLAALCRRLHYHPMIPLTAQELGA